MAIDRHRSQKARQASDEETALGWGVFEREGDPDHDHFRLALEGALEVLPEEQKRVLPFLEILRLRAASASELDERELAYSNLVLMLRLCQEFTRESDLAGSRAAGWGIQLISCDAAWWGSHPLKYLA